MHDPHHVYLDLDVINNDYKNNGAPPYLRFEEIRNTPFLDGDSSEYLCSIVRFTVQTGNTLPVITPRIANPVQPKATIYTVSLSYQDPTISNGKLFVATEPIIYEPEDKTTKVQTNPTGGQDLSGTYYHVHNYTHCTNIVHNALAVALSKLKTRCRKTQDQVATLIDWAVAPYLDFDPTTNRVI